MQQIRLDQDIPAGLVVFLVALPLCLGVAVASGAPALSGIISGIVGGIIVGFLSQSQTSVSGPAAGLTAVVLAAITQLGSFELFLSAVMIAGFIQLILGFLRAGVISQLVPSSVIKGLLAAIGVILILKQIPHAIGYDNTPEDDFSFLQSDGENTFSSLFKAFGSITPGALIIGLISITLLFVWKKTPMAKIKSLPSSLVVVVLGVFINLIFSTWIPALQLEGLHTVNLPDISGYSLVQFFHLPAMEDILDYSVLLAAFTIALIASLETLLNLEAVDKIDPKKRFSPPNQELMAQGIGNIFSGFLGGIPITSVIVRSSVNIEAGNSSKASTIIHGVFILLSVVFLSSLINLIPLASLAAILIVTGYKLASPDLFMIQYKKGWGQFLPFIITILAILFTDLLIGVVVGIIISSLNLLYDNFHNPYLRQDYKLHIGSVTRLELSNQVTFLNKPAIKKALWSVPEGERIIIDATHTSYIDEDIRELIKEFQTNVVPQKNIQLNIIHSDKLEGTNNQISFLNVLDKDTRKTLSPEQILNLLKAGNRRFIEGKSSDKFYNLEANATAQGVNPMAVVLNCIDSRTSPEIIFDTGLGDVTVIRIAGNIVGPPIIASLEIAVGVLGAKLIVVKGHSNCGAVKLALQNSGSGNIHFVTDEIKFSLDQWKLEHAGTLPEVDQLSRQNIRKSLANIILQSELIRNKLLANEIGLVGCFHEIKSGVVEFEEMIDVRKFI